MKFEVKDISSQVFGKYQYCTKAKDGLWYADSDFEFPGGFGNPKTGAIPSPRQGSKELDEKAKKVIASGGYGVKEEVKPIESRSFWSRLFG